MVLDTSALVAILFDEPEAERFRTLLGEADDPLISAGTLVEASIVMQGRTGEGGILDLDDLLDAASVRCVAVDHVQARLARGAFARFGKGRHPAGLNLGDCFAYALARAMNRPLLFEGRDFAQTDIASAG